MKNNTLHTQKQQRAGYYRQKVSDELRFIPSQYGTEIVELNLPSGPRRLGSIHITGRTFKSNRNKSHILKTGNAISLNEKLLKSGRFDWITIFVKDHVASPFVTSTDFMLNFGSRVCYSAAGFEVQVSLPLDLWGIEKARRYHDERTSQQNLNIFKGLLNE